MERTGVSAIDQRIHSLTCMGGCPQELDKRIAALLGWTQLRFGSYCEDGVASSRAVGIPPGESRARVVPEFGRSVDAQLYHEPLTDLLVNDQKLLGRYIGWMRYTGHSEDSYLLLAYPPTRATALILALEGSDPPSPRTAGASLEALRAAPASNLPSGPPDAAGAG